MKKCFLAFATSRIAILTLVTSLPLVAVARMFQIVPPEELMANSTLVFVGKVQGVETSKIATSLSYPTWEGVSFPWLKVEAEVTAPVKGVKRSEIVHVMMLSISNSDNHAMFNGPEVLEPEQGDIFFFCLSPTTATNSFAAMTAPYNEFLSIIPLHRAHEAEPGHKSRDSGARLLFFNDQRFTLIRNIANESGEIVPQAVTKLKETYATEIANMPTNQIVYLEWRARTNAAGWIGDVPKDSSPTNSIPK
jgi:hypothetical protein